MPKKDHSIGIIRVFSMKIVRVLKLQMYVLKHFMIQISMM